MTLCPSAVILNTDVSSYHTNEGGNILIDCYIKCSENITGILVQWHLEIPATQRSQTTSRHLENELIRNKTESQYGIQITLRNNTISCVNGIEKHFFLDIVGVKANLSHSVVRCGINGTYIPIVTYIIVNKIGELNRTQVKPCTYMCASVLPSCNMACGNGILPLASQPSFKCSIMKKIVKTP